MNQALAVWLVILLALVSANLPFILERPLLILPWAQNGETPRPAWLQWIESVVFLVCLGALAYLCVGLVGNSLFGGFALLAGSMAMFTVLGVIGAAILLLGYPGWRSRGHIVHKSFFTRLLEVLTCYVLVGSLGLGFELNIGNAFMQTWEFYAVTLCLYVVLAYPGFVFRYLLRRKRRKPDVRPEGQP